MLRERKRRFVFRNFIKQLFALFQSEFAHFSFEIWNLLHNNRNTATQLAWNSIRKVVSQKKKKGQGANVSKWRGFSCRRWTGRERICCYRCCCCCRGRRFQGFRDSRRFPQFALLLLSVICQTPTSFAARSTPSLLFPSPSSSQDYPPLFGVLLIL